MSPVRLPAHVGIVEQVEGEDAVVYAAPLPDGPIVVLRDTALTIWQEAVRPTSQLELPERVARHYGLPVEQVQAAVDSCVADLLARGVLEVATGD